MPGLNTLDREELLSVLEKRQLGVVSVNLWIEYVIFEFILTSVIVVFHANCVLISFMCRHLHNDVVRPYRNATYVFIDPFTTAQVGPYRNWNRGSIKTRLIDNSNDTTLFLAPMNVG